MTPTLKETKFCNHCKTERPISEFWKNKSKKDGVNAWCRFCGNEAAQRSYAKNIEINRLRKINSNNKSIEKHRDKYEARRIFEYEVKVGRILRKLCAVCGESKVEGHHFDYSKPLEVIWLCRKHHHDVHREINREMKVNEDQSKSQIVEQILGMKKRNLLSPRSFGDGDTVDVASGYNQAIDDVVNKLNKL